MIRLDQVSKQFAGSREALRQVSFSLERGEMAFLTGHSGAGKSTLLRLIMLMERASQGQVWVDGQNLNRLPAARIPLLRRRIGFVMQNPLLLPDRSVFDNVALPLVVSGYHEDDIARRTRAALSKVGLLSKERLQPLALSAGEQQRVGIARAIVNKPHLLLADEPTGNLDPQLSGEIIALFRQFNQVGVTVLVASHDQRLIDSLNYRVLTLKSGCLVSDQRRSA